MKIPYITKKQQDIIYQILKFRFLNSTQIQKLFKHKDKRRINGWLKQLKELDYLAQDNDDTANTDKSKPAIYHLDLNGIRFLKLQGVGPTLLHKLYRENKRSAEFINHSLFLADIFLDLRNHTTKEDFFTFYTQSDYFQTSSPYEFLKGIHSIAGV